MLLTSNVILENMDKYTIIGLLIQGIVAFGTLLVAIMAIWGEKVKSFFFPPQLNIEFINPYGDLTKWDVKNKKGKKVKKDVIFYHLVVTNKSLCVARRCAVYLRKIEKKKPDGKIEDIPLNVPHQFKWAISDNASRFIDIHKCLEWSIDFGYIFCDSKKFVPRFFWTGFNFKGCLEEGETIRYYLQIVADNYYSKEWHQFEVYWNGVWTDNLGDMKENFKIMKTGISESFYGEVIT